MKYYYVTFYPSDYRWNKNVILRTNKPLNLLELWVCNTCQELYGNVTVDSIEFNESEESYCINKGKIDEITIVFGENIGYEI